MNSSPAPRFKVISYAALFASILFGIVGQLLMKYTMSHKAGELLSWTFIQQLALALTVYSLGVINWIYALRFVKLSIAYPLTSLNYVGIILGSYYFFNEEITVVRVVGIALVFTGVVLVAIPVNFAKRSQEVR